MEKYIRITNKDKKMWILPCRNLKVALCLYQPSSVKGKALRKLLPVLAKFPVAPKAMLNKLGIKKQKESISEELRKYLFKVYPNAADIQFAAFLGTPGVHQKITVQISTGNRILGYCKVTENQEIYRLFQHEQKILQYLEKCGMTGIPRCICCDDLGNGKYVFIQTTVKTVGSDVRHELGTLELDFIHRLAECTEKTVAFEQTDFSQSVHYLKRKIGVLKENGFRTKALERACNNVIAYYQNQNKFSAYHRDFTPWNSFVEDGKLFVFDFEYAALQYPAYLDAIHYFCQTTIFEKKVAGKAIFELYCKECKEGSLRDLFLHPEIALQAYLVDIISVYCTRGEGVFRDDGTIKLLKIWTELCEYVLLNE